MPSFLANKITHPLNFVSYRSTRNNINNFILVLTLKGKLKKLSKSKMKLGTSTLTTIAISSKQNPSATIRLT